MNILPAFWEKSNLKQKLLTLSSSIVLLYCSGASSIAIIDDKPEPDVISTVLEEIKVLGITPLSSAISSDKSSRAIQIFNAQDIAKTIGYSIAQLLEQQAGSITSNAAQNNPLQPDIRLRGFTASPLLGVSQGVVVYQNGVRINETFGDTVNWDLLPISTVESVGVVAGSNPVLGLNALGGAITLKTKDGFSAPQRTMTLEYGSFETHALNITSGGNNDSWGYFITIDGMEEEGWRDFSNSQALNAYAALSWRDKSSELDVYLNRGDTHIKLECIISISTIHKHNFPQSFIPLKQISFCTRNRKMSPAATAALKASTSAAVGHWIPSPGGQSRKSETSQLWVIQARYGARTEALAGGGGRARRAAPSFAACGKNVWK